MIKVFDDFNSLLDRNLNSFSRFLFCDGMSVSGVADLPLHTGGVPRWLWKRMVKLARGICLVIINESGRDELLRRLADPFWFQALGCVLGFDWHSSGVTTVVTAALKVALDPEECGIAVCGGKGKVSLKTPSEIEHVGRVFSWSSSRTERIKKISKLAAKVDSAALQDGFSLYHHSTIVSEDGKWIVVQQGMCPELKIARRYHWSFESSKSLIEEPHSSIVSDVVRDVVLDLTSRSSKETRETCLDLVSEDPKKLKSTYRSVYHSLKGDVSILNWVKVKERPLESIRRKINVKYLYMPVEMNWRVLQKLHELEPKNFEELLMVRGVGGVVLRGLALISMLIYGTEASWEDPAIYSFAFGGKDGVPFPVNTNAMDRAISFLEEAIRATEIDEKEKRMALRRLGAFVKKVEERVKDGE